MVFVFTFYPTDNCSGGFPASAICRRPMAWCHDVFQTTICSLPGAVRAAGLMRTDTTPSCGGKQYPRIQPPLSLHNLYLLPGYNFTTMRSRVWNVICFEVKCFTRRARGRTRG